MLASLSDGSTRRRCRNRAVLGWFCSLVLQTSIETTLIFYHGFPPKEGTGDRWSTLAEGELFGLVRLSGRGLGKAIWARSAGFLCMSTRVSQLVMLEDASTV